MLSMSSTPNPLLATAFSSSSNKSSTQEATVINSASSLNGHGTVNLKHLNHCFKKLVSNAAPGVLFKKNLLEKSCWGGTCSAQSLNFSTLFMNPKYAHLGIKERFITVAKECTTSSLELRTKQAALNAITEDKANPSKDFDRAKVESIVALNDFKVVYASDPIRHKDGEISLEDFKKTVIKLPEGLYFTRLLATCDNHKKEAYGHSVLFLNSKEGCFFWDPMGNSYHLDDKKVIEQLYEIIGGTNSRWGLENPRFYKIIPNHLAVQTKPCSLLNRVQKVFKRGIRPLRTPS